MIPKIHDIQTIVTGNEIEALILESNLIKKYKPKFNQSLKDDKKYAWIHINTYKKFPKIKRTRQTDESGQYFGPYPDGRPINRMLKYLRKLYPYADCNLEFYPERKKEDVKKSRICLYYHLDQCPGPCDNLLTPDKYKKNIYNIIKTLKGKKKSHLKHLSRKMQRLARKQKFEKAAEIRDKIKDLKYLSQRIDIDFGDTEEDFKRIREERYLAGLQEAISKLGINIPQHKIKTMRTECYDISNIKGQIAYGSMVVAIGKKVQKSQYRIFKIKDPKSTDDTSMLKEVLQRRLKYFDTNKKYKTHKAKNNKKRNLKKTNSNRNTESLLQKPDLIILDGGRGQLSKIYKIIPSSIGLMGISKGKHLKRAGKKQVDEFWKVSSDKIVRKIKISSPYIFQQLRDEAHRFAIKHHRKGRRHMQTQSVLDEITGVGPKRRKALLKKFKTVDKIKKTSVATLNEVIKNQTVAKRIHTFFEKRKSNKQE
jgi:excinuclease ABC subunit C